MTDEELQELCRVWQRRLRLQDWDIVAKFKRVYDMDSGADGLCEFLLKKKQAFIRILDPNDYDPSSVFPYDPEKTLIHELLHLLFAPFDELEGPRQITQEQAICALSTALVELVRKDDKHGEESEKAPSGERGEVPEIEVELS